MNGIIFKKLFYPINLLPVIFQIDSKSAAFPDSNVNISDFAKETASQLLSVNSNDTSLVTVYGFTELDDDQIKNTVSTWNILRSTTKISS